MEVLWNICSWRF